MTMVTLKLAHKGRLLVILVLLLQLGFVAVLAGMLKNAESQIERERIDRDIIFEINRLSSLMDNAGIGLAQQLQDPDKPDSEAYRASYGQYLELIPKQVADIAELTKGTREEGSIKQLFHTINHGLTLMEVCRKTHTANAPLNQERMAALQELSRDAGQQIQEILRRLKTLQQTELNDEARSRETVTAFLTIGLLLNIIGAIFLVGVITDRMARRVERVRDNALRLSMGMPLHSALQSNDEIGALDEAFHDMAAHLNEALRREQVIINNATELILSIDEKLTFMSVNAVSMKILEFAPEELIGKRCVEIIHEDDKSKTIEMLKDAISRKTTVEFESRLRTKSQATLTVGWSVQWSSAEKALFCVLHDITQRKEVEKMKKDFVAMVSHDLRAPLTSMQLALEMVSMGVYGQLAEAGQERITNAESTLTRLIALVNGLLSVEKMESGDLELHPRMLDVDEILDPSIHSIQGIAERQFVALKKIPHAQCNMYLDCDRMIQVFVNLLSNAVKFSPKNGVVKVSVSEKSEFVRFEVIDQGRGVPEHLTEVIFDRYRQVQSSDETQKGGTGLGLTICKAIVEMHGGKIGVSSNAPEPGSTFWIEIPKTTESKATVTG